MKSKYVKWGLMVIAGLWAAFLGTMIGYAWNRIRLPVTIPKVEMPQVQNKNISIETQEKLEGYWTVAVFGVDSRDGILGKDTRSDLQMILNINLGTGEIRIVSVYRDTYLKIDEKEHYDKINEAYFRGGTKQAVEALSQNLDLAIDNYASFSWKSVADAINILGGIDVNISRAEFRIINGYITETVKSTGVGSHQLKKPGLNHLDGIQAVAYARLRKMDSDCKRTERQREVVNLVLKKARKANVVTLEQVVATVMPQIATNIGLKDLLPLIKNVKRFHLTETNGFPFYLRDARIGKRACLIPVTLEKNVKHLHKFLFDEEDYKPSYEVKETSRQIRLRVKNIK